MSFTRRHWGRELLGALLFPLSMFLRRTRGADGKPGPRELSMQRVILGVFVWRFAQHFPTDWTEWSVAALGVLVFALIVEALFAAVPVREGLAALLALFGSATGHTIPTALVTTSTTVETQGTPEPS